ncbi:MAG: hypothetical protein ABSF69_08630 [Polyangiaceae bacterium]
MATLGPRHESAEKRVRFRARLAAVAGDPQVAVVVLAAAAMGVGITWGLPGSDSWATDAISPRSCGLGAIVETYWPGHFHTYPPLHMAILTVLSLPWMAAAAVRVGTGVGALSDELIKPLYMTGIELGARAVAIAMAVGALCNTMRLWARLAGPRVALGAGIVVAANATFIYYAHTGNVDVPYLFWVTGALVEMDRVMSGEPRETRALLLATAAVLTKDQAAAALLIPLVLAFAVSPKTRRVSVARPAVRDAVVRAAVAYAVVSGAIVNPVGFAHRVAFLLGPASQTWAGYPRGLRGALALAHDAVAATPRFTSGFVAVAALVGVMIAVTSRHGVTRVRALLPLSAAVSFTLFFTLAARRSEDRFLLPQSLFALPYAALAFDAAWVRWPRAHVGLAACAAAALVPALLGVASLDATLLNDSRYAAERYLATLPTGTHVEVYGGPIFLPRIPTQIAAVRPGIEPIADRERIAGVEELVDPAMDPRPRAPSAIVLATELSNHAATDPPARALSYALAQYRDAQSHALFRGLLDGSLGYVRALRATCTVSWPLACREVHRATAGEVWIYRPKAGVGPPIP